MAGWAGSAEWNVVDGELVNSGSGYGTDASVTAHLMLNPGMDFAVEAEIQLL